MTIAEAPPQVDLDQRPAGEHRRTSAWGRLPETAVLSSLGVLLVALADTAGRHQLRGGVPLFWVGTGLIFAPIAVRLVFLRTRLGDREPAGLAVLVAVTTFVTKLCYSPLSFSFPDELQHWRSTADILRTHQLFTANTALPISPHYPGLEIATAAISSITGLSIFAAGVVLTAAAHLILATALYCVFLRLSGSGRVAALGVLAYSTNAHFASFDAMFLYQALGLTFLAFTLLAVVGAVRGGQRAGWIGLAALGLIATVITHHVTSYLLLVALVVSLGITALKRRSRAQLCIVGGLTAGGLVAIAAWVAGAAPQTVSYLHGPVAGIVDSVRGLLIGLSATKQAAEQVPPAGDRLFSAAAAVLVAVLLPVAWLSLRRRVGSMGVGANAMLVVSAGYYVVLAVRIGVSDGQELAGRLMSFEFIPVAYVLALFAVTVERQRKRAAAREIAALATGGVLGVGAVTGGWPPWWERLPGPYLVAGFERSVDAEAVAASVWTHASLGANQRFGADAGNAPLLASYGNQDVVRNLGPVYTVSGPTSEVLSLVKSSAARYLLVDERLATMLPASGAYFPVDPNANRYRAPLPISALDKFDDAGASRLYDSGDIVIYDLQGSDYAP
jgi:hypothetical protein